MCPITAVRSHHLERAAKADSETGRAMKEVTALSAELQEVHNKRLKYEGLVHALATRNEREQFLDSSPHIGCSVTSAVLLCTAYCRSRDIQMKPS